MALSWDAGTVSFAAAGLVNLALAVTLVTINMTSRVNRVFAVFLTVRGVLNLTTVFSEPETAADLGDRVAPYFRMAVPIAAAYFGVVYWALNGPRPSTDARRVARPTGIVLVLMFIVLAALYGADPSLYHDALTGGTGGPGPLYVFTGLNLVGYAAVAVVLVRMAGHSADDLQRRSVLTVAIGFALNPAFAAATAVALGLTPWTLGPTATLVERIASTWALVAGLLILGATIALVGRARRNGRPEVRHDSRRAAVSLAVPVVTAAVVWVGFGASPIVGQRLNDVFAAVWVLSLPALVTYALLKHQLFGLEVRVRSTVKRSTVAGLFAAAFFIASETIEAYLPVEGTMAGIAAAGALALGLRPIQRFAESVAGTLMPDARPLTDLTTKDRMAMYMETVRVAWADGNLTEKDRRLLEVGRKRLGLAPDEAQILESTVISTMGLRPSATKTGA